MYRRKFISLFTAGLIGIGIPAKTIQLLVSKDVVREAALSSLTRAWRNYIRYTGSVPTLAYVGSDFFEAMESELMSIERFVSTDAEPNERTLRFKTCTVKLRGKGWWYLFV